MGLLDFLFDKEKSAERKLQKAEKKVTNMFLQAPERQYVFTELRDVGTSEAVWILLQRYNENNPNTTLDIEEKQLVFDILKRMARDADADVIGQVKRFVLEKEEKINWPMKVLQALLPEDEYIAFIVEVLETCQTEYQRTVEKKQELMLRSTELEDPALADQIARFICDDNETIRFLAFDAALNQKGTEALSEAMFSQFLTEESGRIQQKLPQLVGRRDVIVPEELREQVGEWLHESIGIHKEGHLYRRRQ
ncbi:MAG: hypothetical protein VYE40_11830 [Myxococcota bacterium]|jgi:hypothetical protein|nr:hypothetical protein [Myxococcota bacterium]